MLDTHQQQLRQQCSSNEVLQAQFRTAQLDLSQITAENDRLHQSLASLDAHVLAVRAQDEATLTVAEADKVRANAQAEEYRSQRDHAHTECSSAQFLLAQAEARISFLAAQQALGLLTSRR